MQLTSYCHAHVHCACTQPWYARVWGGGDRCPELHYTSVHTPSSGRACHATVPQHGVNLSTSITSGECVKTFLNRDVRTLCTSLHIPRPHSRIVCGCVCPATDVRWCRHLDTCGAHCRARFNVRHPDKHWRYTATLEGPRQLSRSSLDSLNTIEGMAYGSLRTRPSLEALVTELETGQQSMVPAV
jgi:hypothetical protein